MTTKKVLSGAHVEITFNEQWWSRNEEARAKRLAQAAAEFKDFVRDHRSQDVTDVFIVHEFEYQCEHCKTSFNYDVEKPECCEKAIREWASNAELELFGYEIETPPALLGHSQQD